MKTNIKFNIIIFLSVLLMSACSKEEDISTTTTGSFQVVLENVVGDDALVLNNESYVNANGDTFTVTKFNYYISNIQLIKEDGAFYTYPKDSSFFLVKADDAASKEIVLNNIPTGNYKGIKFVLGIDSLTNTDKPIEERTGVLSGSEGMYWVWNSGYIFLKIEGSSPQIDSTTTNPNRNYKYHIGGFGGYSTPTINNIKEITIQSSNPASVGVVKSNKTTQMHIMADVLNLFETPNTLSLGANPTIMFSPLSVQVADNYADMFSFDHFHNPN
ncbi:MAG: hypothetical protein H6553_10710 [Chitinophagales bacterium]|nr:hypothetical protein [Chitinophagales bacterium]